MIGQLFGKGRDDCNPKSVFVTEDSGQGRVGQFARLWDLKHWSLAALNPTP